MDCNLEDKVKSEVTENSANNKINEIPSSDEIMKKMNHTQNNSNCDKENCNPNAKSACENTDDSDDENRRPDEPTKLSFAAVPENAEEKAKRKKIEEALKDPNTKLEVWREFAKSEYGLINDDLRRCVWPLLLNLNRHDCESVPKLEELSNHPEYNQVILDVNRSLKRFPPGIPYEQRVALQDQLTVLILRVITKYPHLNYYQGYHDVAITFLLVVGEEVAFHVMEILSTDHLVECMQKTFEIVQRRLMLILAIVWRENRTLYEFLERSQVGLLFALPWYLTWFGHSLNSYRAVVRLYDYFLASEPLMPLYLTGSIILYREEEAFREDCDRASLHCLLSQLPEDLPFEYLLVKSEKLYEQYPPHILHKDIETIMEREKKMREEEDQMFEKRRQMIMQRKKPNAVPQPLVFRWMPRVLLTHPKSFFVTTAFSVFVGLYYYFYNNKVQMINVDIIR